MSTRGRHFQSFPRTLPLPPPAANRATRGRPTRSTERMIKNRDGAGRIPARGRTTQLDNRTGIHSDSWCGHQRALVECSGKNQKNTRFGEIFKSGQDPSNGHLFENEDSITALRLIDIIRSVFQGVIMTYCPRR